MGVYFLDQYSLLHFATGILWRHLNLGFITLLIFHIIFEYVENTKNGMHFINKYFTFWPGGKPKSDTFINSFGDIISSLVGWEFMNLCIQKNISFLGEQFQFGIFLYFWLYPKIGLIMSMLIIVFVNELYNYNLLYGFIISFILDKLGLYYGYYEPHSRP